MKELIEEFAQQIKKGVEIFNSNTPNVLTAKYANVVISGLGGSGIGGTIVKDLSTAFANIPVVVNKEYTIPFFVNSQTLFIASSYSGDTEETFAATQMALQKNATVICITSGGKLAQLAQEKKLTCLLIPGGNPPRACLGYSLTQLICIFLSNGLLPKTYMEDLSQAAIFLKNEKSNIIEKAKNIANEIFGKKVIIYSEASHEGLAIRFRQQLNENAKRLCWHHVVPEMNHNELVGWTQKADDHVVIFLRNVSDNNRNQHRIEINKKIISQFEPSIIEIWGEGNNEVERVFYTIHLVDWVSYFLSQLNDVDIMDIKVIDYLKKKLSEID